MTPHETKVRWDAMTSGLAQMFGRLWGRVLE